MAALAGSAGARDGGKVRVFGAKGRPGKKGRWHRAAASQAGGLVVSGRKRDPERDAAGLAHFRANLNGKLKEAAEKFGVAESARYANNRRAVVVDMPRSARSAAMFVAG